MDRLTEERIAANNARFRDANEHIRDAAVEHGVTASIPFICECPDETCMEIVRIELDEYRAVREHPRRFVNAPGHDRAAGSSVRVVSEHDGHVVVEKVGLAGEIAEELAGGAQAFAADRDREE
ncbi:MAG: hypothetical protein M3321_12865 [Actinomycetota bacterium]|nr:hypothetical protein [Actinomycetota bacterium]